MVENSVFVEHSLLEGPQVFERSLGVVGFSPEQPFRDIVGIFGYR